MEKHPIDQIFRDKLGDFEMNPSVDLLDQIQQQVAYRGRVRRINQVKTILSIAAALVLVLMAGWYTITPEVIVNNSVPSQIQPNILPVNPEVEKSIQVTPSISNQQLALQQKQQQPAAVKTGRPGKKAATTIKIAPQPTVSVGSELLANEPTSGELNNGVDQSKQSAVSKNEKKSDPSSKTNTRGAELPYFADSNFSPANQEGGSAKGSWGIKAELSPMFSPQNQASAVGSAVTKSINTVCGGMIAAYKVNDKLSISTGIRFSQMKQGTHTAYALNAKSGITYLEPVEKSANIAGDVSLYLPSKSSIVYFNGMQVSPTNAAGSDISQEFKYLEIPVQATYKLLDNKLSLGVTGGISTNILVGNYASITENGIKISNGNTQNLRDVIYAGSAGIELGYGLGKNLVLTVEPRLKQYMHSVSSNDQINYKPLQMGIFTGITYSFQ